MRGRMMFLAGLGIGYVLGTRAGRERYEQLMQLVQKVRANPTVQEAAGMVQSQTSRWTSGGGQAMRSTMNRRFGNTRLANTKLGQRLMGGEQSAPATAAAHNERQSTRRPSHF